MQADVLLLLLLLLMLQWHFFGMLCLHQAFGGSVIIRDMSCIQAA